MNTTPEEMLVSINEIIKENKIQAKYNLQKELKSIIAIVTRVTGLDIRDKIRTRDYVNARMIYAYMSRRFTSCTFKEIGMIIRRNHATILHLNKHYEGVYKTDDDFRKLSDRCLSRYFSDEGIEQPKVEAIENINDELLKCDHTKLLRVKNYVEKIIEYGN
jgi:tryptophan 2,3-dioxygenase